MSGSSINGCFDEASDQNDNDGQLLNNTIDSMKVIVSSFGHKHDTPGADYVLNARKVNNPGRKAQNSTGLNKKVWQIVFQDQKALTLVQERTAVVETAVKQRRYQQNEDYPCSSQEAFHLAIGCDPGCSCTFLNGEKMTMSVRVG